MTTHLPNTKEFYQTLLFSQWLENTLATSEQYGSQFTTTTLIEKSLLLGQMRHVYGAQYLNGPVAHYLLDAIQERCDVATMLKIRDTMLEMSSTSLPNLEAVVLGLAEQNTFYPGHRLVHLLAEAETLLQLEMCNNHSTKVIELNPAA